MDSLAKTVENPATGGNQVFDDDRTVRDASSVLVRESCAPQHAQERYYISTAQAIRHTNFQRSILSRPVALLWMLLMAGGTPALALA